MTSREETVLPPIDPSISDENDWWEFGLSEVKVLRPGKMLYANLLEATEKNPVQVIGELQLKPNQEHLVLSPDALSKRMIIDDVTHYAYGQAEDRSVQLWVAGRAGWYRISPAKGYLPHFNRMVQAVDMYYFLIDRHQHGKKQLNPTYRNLCEQYVFHTHGDCETREQSAETFGMHGPFLLRCMIEDDEDMEWNKTNVFIHLRRQFKSSNDEEEEEDEPEVMTPRHDPAAIAKSQTDAVYHLIQELKDEGHLAKRRLHMDLLSERLSKRYSFSKENAHKIIAARASAVLEKLDEEDIPGFKWSRYVIHRELTHAATLPDPLPPALLTPLQPIEDSSDDEALMRTHKSVLRPKNASVSRKVMGKRNRNGTADQKPTQSDDDEDHDDNENDDDDDPDAMSDVETPSKIRGHELIRTPLASAKPQTRSFLGRSGTATSLLQTMLQDTPQTSTTLASTLPIENSILGNIPPLPDLTTNTDPDPDPEPEPEPDTWTCRMQDCSKVITTKGDERQKEIEHHAGEHDWEMQMRIELVESERRMHSVFPVSNLIKYLLGQHLQQMREAFPEIHHGRTGINGINGNGDENGMTEQSQSVDDDESSIETPSRPSLVERNQDMNGHTS
ncbi:uncharacterized protein N7483_010452 [Penicillium malachiteum]|uniref:uncharacterized protein n=1 Tax=Penicillium malachiteum TaxID=1324776 RepID=UPI002548A881|nr:uncharacterized protein N7483_010452 [Penicillium malachiteum]KAJ5713271.1 hypothetical protein N7483_010452 [Penicillium malachiteum]